MEIDEPTDKERDDAFVAGWNSELVGDNPYKSTLARIFVDGWVMRVRLTRLGLINADR